jgi:hypothetical protein
MLLSVLQSVPNGYRIWNIGPTFPVGRNRLTRIDKAVEIAYDFIIAIGPGRKHYRIQEQPVPLHKNLLWALEMLVAGREIQCKKLIFMPLFY